MRPILRDWHDSDDERGAAAGNRDFYLYEHLARVLPDHGIAVLRFDRRPGVDGRDVPFQIQAADARAALEVLRQHAGDVPVGLGGISQGGWVEAISPHYTTTMTAWLDVRLSAR